MHDRTRRPVGEYPREYEGTVSLPDETLIFVRPARPDDAQALLDLHRRLSPQSWYQRFFTPMADRTGEQFRRLLTPDYVDSMALVAECGNGIVGVASYVRLDGTEHAEAAVTVEDAHQGYGIGPVLLWRLIEVARDSGIRAFEADVLTDNRRMLRILARTRFEIARRDGGMIHVVVPIDSNAPASTQAQDRSQG